LAKTRPNLSRCSAGSDCLWRLHEHSGSDVIHREAGTVGYWRWGGQHLVRYERWEAGEAWDGKAPALLLVHGFAASAEQWERLVAAMRARMAMEGCDSLPPIYALDLLGFGHSEKPGLSYTQYVWEAQIVDVCSRGDEGRAAGAWWHRYSINTIKISKLPY
jgi:pimeloyl-ACP methyl ester carboxylesterase